MKSTVRLFYCGFVTMALVGLTTAHAQGLSLDEQLQAPVNRESVNQQRDVADQLLRLGERQRNQGDYQSALKAWEQAFELYYKIGDAAAMERVYGHIGQTYAQLGDHDRAETAVRRQLAIARDNQNFTSQIFAWNTLGTLRLQRGALESANQAFEEALTIAYSLQNEEGIGLSLTNLGLLAAVDGNYDTAISYYETASGYRVRGRNLIGRANTSNNLGDAYFAQGQLARAIGAYRLGLRYGRDSDDVNAQLQAIDGFIDVYSERNDWSQVRHYLDERIALTLNTGNDWERLITFKRLGDFYEATGESALAQAEYTRAYELARLLEQTDLEVELFNQLLSLQNTLDSK